MRTTIGLTLIALFMTTLIIAQDEQDTPTFTLSIGNRSCDLTLIEPEDDDIASEDDDGTSGDDDGIEEDAPPTYTIGDDCEGLQNFLADHPSNERLWLALSHPEEDGWLELETTEDDDYPPQLDRRGRFFGCLIPEQGEQACFVSATLGDTTYAFIIPFTIGNAYYAPQPQSIATEEPISESTATFNSQGQNVDDTNPQDNDNQDAVNTSPEPTQAPFEPTLSPVPGNDTDSDGDGILDYLDDCPYEWGVPEYNGCPPPEATAELSG